MKSLRSAARLRRANYSDQESMKMPVNRGSVWMVAILVQCCVMGSADDSSVPLEEDITSPQVTEQIINAPVAEVWKVFTTAEGFKKLGPAQCELDFRIGGLIKSHYDPHGKLGDEGTIQNVFLSYEPERMVSFRIQQPPKGFPFAGSTWKSVWSVVTLSDLGNGRTHVRLAGIGYPDTEDGRKMREFFARGNAWTMSHLKAQFDNLTPPSPANAHTTDPLAPIETQRVVELSRQQVWELFTTSQGWKRFLNADAEIELRPGGKFEIAFNPAAPPGERGSEGCTVLSFIPGRMLSYTWNAPPKFAHARQQHSWVVLQFDELATSRTRVSLQHFGFDELAAENPEHLEEWKQVRTYFNQAWAKVLDAVQAVEIKESKTIESAPPGR